MGHLPCYVVGMSVLTSASTWDEVYDAYLDNASYLEDGSAAKARAFTTACRLLLLLLPKRISKGGRVQGEEIELDIRVILDQIGEAKRFLTQTAVAAAPPKSFSIEHFRD